MRIINHLCPHGLTPGPWNPWDDEHMAEHAWLISLYRPLLRADVVMIPTEAIARADNSFMWHKAAWMVERIESEGMTAGLWLDKWLYTRAIFSVRARLLEGHRALLSHDVIWNLSNELDLVWLLHDIDKGTFLDNLALAKNHLLNLGVSRDHIWAGGATVEGTKTIADYVAPGMLTWTAWRALQHGLSMDNISDAIAQDVDQLPRPLTAIEVGWSVAALPPRLSQATILEQALRPLREENIDVGLWLPIDTVHETRPEVERRYGLLGVDGERVYRRPGLDVWRDHA